MNIKGLTYQYGCVIDRVEDGAPQLYTQLQELGQGLLVHLIGDFDEKWMSNFLFYSLYNVAEYP